MRESDREDPRQEFTATQCLAMRALRERGERLVDIADRIGTNPQTVSKHVGGTCQHHDHPDPHHVTARTRIREYIDDHGGETFVKSSDIGDAIDISPNLVGHLLGDMDGLTAERWNGKQSPWHITRVATDGGECDE